MTQANMELQAALLDAGAKPDLAEAAAVAATVQEAVTKADLAALELRMTRWATGLTLGLAGVMLAGQAAAVAVLAAVLG